MKRWAGLLALFLLAAIGAVAHLRDPAAIHVTGCWAVEAVVGA
jgi:hypothetical protein